MDETQQAQAAEDLTEAAEKAVESQQQEQEEQQTDEQAQVFEPVETPPADEPDDEGLPKEHKERSDLGRKVSAVHRRMDEIDNKFDRMLQYLESVANKQDATSDLDPDEPLTRRQFEELQKQQREIEEKSKKQYWDSYNRTVSSLGSDLDENQWQAVLAEMSNLTYDPTDKPDVDAKLNFERAEKLYWKKQAAAPQRTNPLKGKPPVGKPGVATNQKSVVTERAMPKLDADAQAYYDYIRRTDGDEKAQGMLKDL